MPSNNRFHLVAGVTFVLLDESGSDASLQAGESRIGRDPNSEVLVNSRYRDALRTHLVIVPFGADTALVTDFFSHGTFVPIRN